MERKIIIASHGNFASGIKSSVEIICGKQENIHTLDAYTVLNYDLSEEVQKLMHDSTGKELIVVTDIFGGSINNEFMKYLGRPDFYLIAGLNLPLLIELVGRINQPINTEQLVRETLFMSKELIQYCNDSLDLVVEEEEF